MQGIRPFQHGFTLVQILFTILILGILAAIAYPAYNKYVQNGRLAEAQNALIENARFMEKFYAQRNSFKYNSTTWPSLPITGNDYFCIRPQGNARGANPERFTLKAVALDKNQEPRIVKINEAQQITVCETSKSTCDEKGTFFSGRNSTDTQCTVLH